MAIRRGYLIGGAVAVVAALFTAAPLAIELTARGPSVVMNEAQAIYGRPLTPRSYAGYARRSHRQAYRHAYYGGGYGYPYYGGGYGYHRGYYGGRPGYGGLHYGWRGYGRGVGWGYGRRGYGW